MGVTVRQKISGKGNPWWVFVAHNGKRTSRMVGSKSAAENVAGKIEAKLTLGEFDLEEGKKEEKPEPTFKEYAETWISTIVPANCRDSTVSDYDDILRLHVLPVFGSLKFKEITKGRLKDFFAEKILEGKAKSTVVHMKNVISGVLTKAVDDELIESNLSRGIKIVQKVKTKDEEDDDEDDEVKDPLTVEEAKLFADTAKAHFPKDYPLCLLLPRTGTRIGEALALRWADADFNGRFINVQRSLSRGKIGPTKNGKSRRVDMSQQLCEVLSAHRTECKKKGLALGLGAEPEYLFTNEKGGLIDVSNWRRRVFWKILDKAGLRRIRIHDLRDTYATIRISKGDNIADVSKQLGHSSVETTWKHYYRWMPGGKKKEVDGLDDVVEQPKAVANES